MHRFWCLVILLLCSQQVWAGILYVPSPDHNTIQSAIDTAVAGDTIIVSPGAYVENIDFKGKAIVVRSENGPANCIIDCNNTSCGFYFHTGEGISSVLRGFTIIKGYGDGGGIYSATSLFINNSI